MEGSVGIETLRKIARRKNLTPPAETIYSFQNFAEFNTLFPNVFERITEEIDFYEIAKAFAEEIAQQEVRYCETFCVPLAHVRRGIPFEKFFPPIVDAFDEAERNLGIRVNLIFSIIRYGGNTGWGHQTLDLIERNPHSRIIGIDLAGPETFDTIAPFQTVYGRAKSLGLHRTAHSGEFCGPDHIRQTIELLQVERIGHGITAATDESLMRTLIDKDIPLEICPASNVMLGAVSSWETHPIRKLYDFGVPLVVSTDDPAFFGNTLSSEYENLRRHFGFTDTEIANIRHNEPKYAFDKVY